MKLEEFQASVACLARASGREEEGLVLLSLEDLQLVASAYESAVAPHERTGLEIFVAWLTLAASILGPAATGIAAIGAGISLAKNV